MAKAVVKKTNTYNPFKPGNQLAKGADHSGRRVMTQQLTSILNEQFQGMKRQTRPVLDKDGTARLDGSGNPIIETIFVKDGKPQDISNLRKVLDNLVFNATVLNDQSAINAIFDRMEGKPAQAITGPEGEPLEATTFIVRFGSGPKVVDGPADPLLVEHQGPGHAGSSGEP